MFNKSYTSAGEIRPQVLLLHRQITELYLLHLLLLHGYLSEIQRTIENHIGLQSTLGKQDEKKRLKAV